MKATTLWTNNKSPITCMQLCNNFIQFELLHMYRKRNLRTLWSLAVTKVKLCLQSWTKLVGRVSVNMHWSTSSSPLPIRMLVWTVMARQKHCMGRPVGWGGSEDSDEPSPTAWKGPLGDLITNNLTGLKHVSHV